MRRSFIIFGVLLCVLLISNLPAYALGRHHHHSDDSEGQEYTGTIDLKESNPDPPAILPVPEPSTILLLGSGLIGLGAYARAKFSRKRGGEKS